MQAFTGAPLVDLICVELPHVRRSPTHESMGVPGFERETVGKTDRNCQVKLQDKPFSHGRQSILGELPTVEDDLFKPFGHGFEEL